MKYVASCSFGKDSLAAIIARVEHGEPVDEAAYCRIMFDDETSAEAWREPPPVREATEGNASPVLRQTQRVLAGDIRLEPLHRAGRSSEMAPDRNPVPRRRKRKMQTVLHTERKGGGAMQIAITIVLLISVFIGTVGAIGGKEKDTRQNSVVVALAAIAAVVIISIMGGRV